MRYTWWQDMVDTAITTVLVFGFIALIGGITVEVIQQNRIERQCLALGYPQGDFRWVGPNYCIKRVNQTDSVLVLPESE